MELMDILKKEEMSSLNEQSKESDDNYIPNYSSIDKTILRKMEVHKKPMMETIEPNAIATFQHYNLRYFENRYRVNVYKNHFLDVLVRVHTNKLMLLALAEGNYIMQSGRKVKEVSFVVNDSDRSLIKTKGKRKYGAKPVHNLTKIVQVLLEGEDQWHIIRAGVEGYLIEANEYVKKEPNLIKTDPNGMGYFAIIMPKGHIHDNEHVIDNMNLLKQEEYIQCLSQRPIPLP